MENKNFAALFCIDRNMRKLVCYLLALVLIAGMALVASESVYAEPDVYQVDFVTPDNVSPIAAQTVESGAFALHPGLADLPNPNPENYVAFVGWYDDLNAGGEPFDFIKTPITADLTLYAKYRTSFVVSYLNGYGDIFYTAEVKPGEVAPELTVAEMGMFSAPVGAYFDHWDLIGDDEEVIREFIPGSEIVYSDLLVRCATTTNRHYIFFHSEGEQVQFQVVDSGAFAVKPADPRRIGYTFDHWADSNGTAFDFETMPITDNLTLSAVWTPTIIQYQLVFWKEKPNVEGDPIVRDSDTGAPLTTQPNFEYQSSFSAYDYAGTSVQDIDIDALIASMEIEYPLYSTYTSGDYIATNGTLLGNGSTIINIYFKKIEYTLYFYIGNDYTLNSEFEKSASAYKMTVNGEEYGWTDYFNFSSSQAQGSIDPASEEALALINNGNHYSFTAKYEDDISAEWPRVANIVKSGRPAYTPIGFYTVFSTGDDTMGTPRMTFESELIPSTGATESIVMTRWLQTVYDKHVHYYFEEVDGDQGMALPSIILSDENIGKTYVEDLDAFSIVNAPTPNKQIEYKVIVGMTPVNTVAIHRNNPNTGDFLPGDVSPTQTKGVHYYLFYNRAYHAVGINTMGGSAPAYNDDVDYNAVAYGDSLDKYIPRSNPERIEDGVEYEFEGWFYDAEYYTPYSAGDIMGDHDVVLYAKWASKEFEVRLYDRLNATEPVQTLYVGLGGYIDESALIYQDNIVYEDGRFNGWKIYIGPGATAWFAFDMPLYQNVDLYADWLDVAYRVVYKNDDPEISGTLPIDPSGYINDTQARVLGNIGDGVGAPLARTVDEIFLGWQKDKDGIIYYRNNLIRMIEDVDLYPRFEQIVGAGMVTFHSNFGEDITVIQPVAKNQPFLLPDEMIFEPLTRPNFVLTGWRLNDEGALLAKYDTYNYGTENGIALYAVWEEGVQYSVRFNLNDRGKTDDPISYLVYKGHTLGEDGVEPPAVTADEYSKFIGWNPVFDPNTAVNEDITFVAQYEALPNLDPSLVGVTSYDGAYSGTPQSAIVKINGGVYNPATPVPGYTVSFSVDDGVTWAANNPAYTNVNKTLDNYKNPVKVKIKADGYAPIIIDSYVRISQASLKITAPSAAVKLGDGIPTDATWVASYEGFVNGETEAALSGSGQIDVAGFDKDIAATYTVTVSGYTSDNYDISYVTGELTVLEAEEVAVKFAPGTSGVFKVGDRTEYAVRVGQTMNEGGVTPPTVIADEYHKFVDWSPAYSDDTVVTGDVTYTAQYEALPELEPGVAVVTPYDGAYSGTPHSLIVVIEGETYNPAAPFPECTVSFSVDGGATWMVDNLPAYTNVDKTLVNYTNPVKVKIKADGYAPIIIDSYVRISQASLKITAPSAAVKLGDGIPTDATWVASYEGFVNGETEAALFGSGQIDVAGFDKDIAATYTVTVSGYTSDNYDISYVEGELTVLEAEEVAVKFAPGTSGVFKVGDRTEYAVRVGQTMNEGGVTPPAVIADEYHKFVDWSPAYSDDTVVTGDVTYTAQYEALPELEPGVAVVTPYDGAYSGTPHSLIVVIEGETYNPAAPFPECTVSFSVDGGATWMVDNLPAYTNVDKTLVNYTNPVKVKIRVDGYAPLIIDSYVRISQASLNITAPSATVKPGDGIPTDATWVASYDGLVNGETEAALFGSGQIVVAGFDKDIAATYTVTVSGYTSDNYDISYVTGTLIVLEDDGATVRFVPGARAAFQEGAITEYTLTIGQTMSEGGVLPPVVIPDTGWKFVGWYPEFSEDIVAVRGGATYVAWCEPLVVNPPEPPYIFLNVSYYDGVYSGTPHSVVVEVDTDSDEELLLEYSTNGVDWSTEMPTFTNVNNANPIGMYVVWVRVSGGTYATVSTQSFVRISKAPLTVSAPSGVVDLGEGIPEGEAWQPSYNGFVNGEDADVLSGTALIEVPYFDANTLGTYEVKVSGLSSGNYEITYLDGELIVKEPAEAAVVFDLGEHGSSLDKISYAVVIGKTLAEGGVEPPEVTADEGWKFIGWEPSFNYTDIVDDDLTYEALYEELPPVYPGAEFEFIDYEGTYTGTEHSISVRVIGVIDGEYTIRYSKDNGDSWSFENPAFKDVKDSEDNRHNVLIELTMNGFVQIAEAYVKITKAPLEISAPSAVIYVGEDIPDDWSLSYEGFVNGEGKDDLILTGDEEITVENFDANTVHVYSVIPAGFASNNYDITYTPGTLEVIGLDTATATVKFESGANGTISGKAEYMVPVGQTMAEGGVTAPEAIADEGYYFTGWDPAFIGGAAVEENETYIYTAQFEPLRSWPDEDLVFSLTPYDGSYTGTGHSVIVAADTSGVDYELSYSTEILDWQSVNPAFKNVANNANDNINKVWVKLTAYGYAPITKESYVRITKAPLTISAPSASIKQGQLIPADWSLSYAGFVNGENADVLSGIAQIAVPSFDTNIVGTYQVIASGYSSDNYDIEYIEGSLSVLPEDATTTTVRFNAGEHGAIISGMAEYTASVGQTMAQNGVTPPQVKADAGYSFTGWAPAFRGSTMVNASGGYDYIAQYTKMPTIDYTDIKSYEGTYTGTGHSVHVNVQAVDIEYQVEYSVDGGATWTNENPVYKDVNIVDPDNKYRVLVKVTTDRNTVVTKAYYVRINPAPLTITAPSGEVELGEGIPVGEDWQLTYDGFVNGEGEADLTRTGDEKISVVDFDSDTAGSYVVEAGGFTSGNYRITYIDGLLIVNDSPYPGAEIIVSDYEGRYTGTEHSVSVEVIGVPDGEYTVRYSTDAGENWTLENPGFKNVKNGGEQYDVLVAVTINGVVHRIPAFVKITKAPLTIEVQDEEIELGGTIPSEWRFLYAGLVGGEEAEDAVSGTAVIDVVDFDANTAGSYQVNVSGFTSGNYAITYSSGNLIVKAPNEAVVKFDLGDYGDTLEETLYTVTVGRTMAQGGVSEPIVRVQNENYEFTGWEPAFSEDIVVSGDITFVAQYALLPALPNPNEIFSITSYNAAYDGDVHAVAVVFIDPDYDADDKVSYSTDGVNYSANNPAYKNVNNEADDNEYPVWVKINVDGYAPYIEKAYVKITKVQLTISAPSGEVDLGAGLPSDEDWKLTYDGFVNGEGRADLTPTGDEQIHVVGFDPETPGEYVVEAGGFTSGNYNITYVPGSLIVREDDTPTLPGAPRNVIASAFVNGAVVVFDPPASDGGSPILFYTVRCRVDDELISEVTTETLSSVYTALTEGVGYTFTVSATNAVGEGPESESSNVATPPGEPEDETLKFNEGIRLFMKYKETKKLNFTADVSSYRFVSSDDSMASVSATGNVTALRTGMVRIFLMATDGSGLISSVVISIAR